MKVNLSYVFACDRCLQVKEYDEISRLDAQKTSLLLEVKNKITATQNDIT